MRRKNSQTKTALLFFFTFLGDFVFGAARTGCREEWSIHRRGGWNLSRKRKQPQRPAKQRSDQGENQAKEGTGDQNEAALEEELLREQEESQEALLEGLELGEMQEAVNELLGEDTFSIREALERILSGRRGFFHGFPDRNRKKFHIRSSAGRPGGAFSGGAACGPGGFVR